MKLTAAEKNELLDLEKSLLDPALRASPGYLEDVLSEGYVEYGASGRVYDRQQAIAAVITSGIDPCTITGFAARWLDPDIALVNYRLICQPGAGEPVHTMRRSIWKRVGGNWKILYHQGLTSVSVE